MKLSEASELLRQMSIALTYQEFALAKARSNDFSGALQFLQTAISQLTDLVEPAVNSAVSAPVARYALRETAAEELLASQEKLKSSLRLNEVARRLLEPSKSASTVRGAQFVLLKALESIRAAFSDFANRGLLEDTIE